MSKRRYIIESNDYDIDGNIYDSVYEYQQAVIGKHGIVHEEVYNAETDTYEHTSTSNF